MRSLSKRQFVWDEGKAQVNERKHGLTFELASTALADKLAGIKLDTGHDEAEDRWVVVGMAEGWRLVVVICTVEDADTGDRVRIISARDATLRERREYESGEYRIQEPVMTNYAGDGPFMENDPDMRVEYDFSKAVRGKFANCRFQVFIDNSTLWYFHDRSLATGTPAEELINDVLRQHVAATGYVAPVFSESR